MRHALAVAFGASIPMTLLMILGAAVVTISPETSDPIGGLPAVFPGWFVTPGWACQGGALSGLTVEWAVELALDAARRADDHAAFRLLGAQLASGDAWNLQPGVPGALDRYSPWLSDWCALPAAQWNIQAAYQAIDVPALHVGGWWDRLARGTVGNFAAPRAQAATSRARDAQRLVIGPWRHMPWSPVPEPGPSGVLPYDPWLAVNRPGGHGCCLADVTPMGPACQCAVEESPAIAVYTSPPLAAPLLIVGDVAAEIWLSTDVFSADLCVRLCVVSPAGCSENLQEGIVRTSAASSPTSHASQVHGKAHPAARTVQAPFASQTARRHRVDLGPVARRLKPGERIRLQVSGSDHPLFDLNLGTGEPWSPGRASFGTTATQVIWHDAAHPSALLLPVIPEENR